MQQVYSQCNFRWVDNTIKFGPEVIPGIRIKVDAQQRTKTNKHTPQQVGNSQYFQS